MPWSDAEYRAFLGRSPFKDKREPVTINAVEREADLHNDVLDECRKRGWIALHGSMAHITHRPEGEPDFIILAQNPDVYLIECKSKTGKLSPEQQAFAAHAAKLGWKVEVIRSMEAFLEIIR